MKKAAEKEGVSLKYHEYFCGISDLSYCGGMDKEELAAYAAQTLLWGSAYAMTPFSSNVLSKSFCA